MHRKQGVIQDEVWQHWQRVERWTEPDFRMDIRSQLPGDLVWSVCEIEPADVEKLFIISSGDWTDISGGTFRVTEVARRMDLPSTHEDTQRIGTNIRKKMEYLANGHTLDRHLFMITHAPSLDAPFTLIEGNHRSVAFLRRSELAGCPAFVGCSPQVAQCPWAQCTYRLWRAPS